MDSSETRISGQPYSNIPLDIKFIFSFNGFSPVYHLIFKTNCINIDYTTIVNTGATKSNEE
jgi:hypothetical protein